VAGRLAAQKGVRVPDGGTDRECERGEAGVSCAPKAPRDSEYDQTERDVSARNVHIPQAVELRREECREERYRQCPVEGAGRQVPDEDRHAHLRAESRSHASFESANPAIIIRVWRFDGVDLYQLARPGTF
jgi:hypothetical protein